MARGRRRGLAARLAPLAGRRRQTLRPAAQGRPQRHVRLQQLLLLEAQARELGVQLPEPPALLFQGRRPIRRDLPLEAHIHHSNNPYTFTYMG